MRSQANTSSEAISADLWIVTAYWHGGSRTITSKAVVHAKSRSEAIRAAKNSFAANASRTWAIKDGPAVRAVSPGVAKNLKRLAACTS